MSCRLFLHLAEGTFGSILGICQLGAGMQWQSAAGIRAVFMLLPLFASSVKVPLVIHTAWKYAAIHRDGGDVQDAKVLWKRSVRLFPALSLCLSMCYLLSIGCIIVEVCTRRSATAQGYFLAFSSTMCAASLVLFMESFTAPKRLLAAASAVVASRTVAHPPPPPNGRIWTGRFGKLMPGVVDEEDSTFTTCAICLDGFQQRDEAARLPCGHIFHSDCLREWLRVRLQCPFRCPEALFLVGQRGELTEERLGTPRASAQERYIVSRRREFQTMQAVQLERERYEAEMRYNNARATQNTRDQRRNGRQIERHFGEVVEV